MLFSRTSLKRAAAHATLIWGCIVAVQLSTAEVAVGTAEISPVASTPVPVADPRDFLLTAKEAGEAAKLTLETTGDTDLGRWARLRWERDRDNSDVRIGPSVLEQTVHVARDLAAARELFGRELGRQLEFPEAVDAHDGPFEFAIAPVGDEVAALSACEDCLTKGTINLHHRVVVRKGPVVSVVYLYGREAVATQDLATWFAAAAANHVPDQLAEGMPVGPTESVAAVPAPAPDPSVGTPPGPVVQGQPRDLAVTLDEAGKWAELADEDAGADDRATWYSARYERPHSYAGFRSGPVTIVSRVFIARDEQVAREILEEQTSLNEAFPEATEEVGDPFGLDLGREEDLDVRGLSACTGSCNERGEIYVHKRLVSRVGTTVSIVYLWGLDHPEGTTDWHVGYFTDLVGLRAHGAAEQRTGG
jgi:hypothetical protein